jgi:hypothetical protein
MQLDKIKNKFNKEEQTMFYKNNMVTHLEHSAFLFVVIWVVGA